MRASKNIIEAMFALYDSTPYESCIRMVMNEMREANVEIEKMENIKKNLEKVGNIVLDKIKDL